MRVEIDMFGMFVMISILPVSREDDHGRPLKLGRRTLVFTYYSWKIGLNECGDKPFAENNVFSMFGITCISVFSVGGLWLGQSFPEFPEFKWYIYPDEDKSHVACNDDELRYGRSQDL
jgi:hypothetical protein